MRRLLPAPAGEVDPADELTELERPPPPGRPWVMVNMVVSVDGAAAVDGLSGELGGDADREVFLTLRGLPDAIMAASRTVKAEDYGPARPSDHVRAERRRRGQSEVPPIVVLSGSVSFDWEHRFFSEAVAPPLIVTTTDADQERVDAARRVADVIEVGTGTVDLTRALAALREREIALLLVEGGPSLNGQLLQEGLVDELHLTLAPSMVSGDAIRIARGDPLAAPYALRLAGIMQENDTLFLRYLRA